MQRTSHTSTWPRFPRSSPSAHEIHIQKQLEVAPSTIQGAGRGVFAKTRIPKDTMLGYYRGSVVPKSELRRRYPDSDLGISYTYTLSVWERRADRKFSVDNSLPEDGECILRYINDGRSKQKNNCEFSWYGTVSTLRDIEPGEELFISYGDAYWGGK